MGVVAQYRDALREEPKLRAFAAASFVDDLGLAASAWAMMLMQTNLFTSQRARASIALPSLAAFLLGTFVSGPLADWRSRGSLSALARWRWRVLVWGRLANIGALGVLLTALASGEPTIANVLPFALLASFLKTALRPSRIAFSVDLLSRETPEIDAQGNPVMDERGLPLMRKTHLLTMASLIGTLEAAAALAGLLGGGQILALASGRFTPLFLVNAGTALASTLVFFLYCHPTRGVRGAGPRDLLRDGHEDAADDAASRAAVGDARRSPLDFVRSLWEGVRFVSSKAQRPLLVLLLGAALVEFVSEAYDGKMIIKHVMGGSDDSVRYAEVAWSLVALAGVAAVPVLTRALGSIGRIFLATMLVDGLVLVVAGTLAARGAGAIVPFVVIITLDHTLTLISGSLTDFAQNVASSAKMRGRIAGTYAIFVILGDMAVEGIATSVSESVGIPAMVARAGVLQVVVVAALAAWGGRALFRFGLREAPSRSASLAA